MLRQGVRRPARQLEVGCNPVLLPVAIADRVGAVPTANLPWGRLLGSGLLPAALLGFLKRSYSSRRKRSPLLHVLHRLPVLLVLVHVAELTAPTADLV